MGEEEGRGRQSRKERFGAECNMMMMEMLRHDEKEYDEAAATATAVLVTIVIVVAIVVGGGCGSAVTVTTLDRRALEADLSNYSLIQFSSRRKVNHAVNIERVS